MGNYKPDRWVVVEFVTPEETIQKVFAGWYGGYAGSDEWRLNSGIVTTRETPEGFEFDGYSGSTYYCSRNNYGMSAYMYTVLESWVRKLEDTGLAEINIIQLEHIVM